MSLKLVDKEDCSTKGGIRKSDRIKLEHKKQTKYHRKRHKSITYVDPDLGIVLIKNISYARSFNGWLFRIDKNNKNEFDYVECKCFDEDGNNERTYIIPKDKIIRYNFLIARRYKGDKWYDKYRMNEKDDSQFSILFLK